MSESRPVIVINLCTRSVDDMFYIRRGYTEAIKMAGGYPIALPLMADREYSKRVIELADGVLLPGSLTDVDPRHYGADETPFFGEKGPERDESDFFLLEAAKERKVPVFGICFGHQSLNVFHGGVLYQDIPHELHSPVTHWQGEPYSTPVHTVDLTENSIVHRIFQKKTVEVNSIHHQGVKKLAPGLRATAISPDGIVEAYESVNGWFQMGVQWHPERMFKEHPLQGELFKEFIAAAGKWRRGNR